MKATFDAFLKPAPPSLAEFIERTELFSVMMEASAVSWTEDQVEQVSEHTWELGFSSDAGLDAICHVEVVAEYGAVEYQVTLTNTSSERCKPISDLWALSLTLSGFEGLPKIVSSSGGAYGKLLGYPGREVYWVRTDMPMSGFGPEFSHGPADGVSSDQDLPIFLATAGAQSDAPGLFLGLEWSGLWHAHFKTLNLGQAEERTDEKRRYTRFEPGLSLKLGPGVDGLVLEPGERLKLPRVHVGFFEGDIDAGSNALRRYISGYLIPPLEGMALPQVTYSYWPGNRDPFTEDELCQHMDVSAELGIETANVDVAWVRGHHPRSHGNWPEDPEKWPSGIEAFAEHARAKGIGLGLFIEMEVVAEGTDFWNEKPHLLFPDPKKGAHDFKFAGFRYRLMNYALPETCDTVLEMVSGLIERLKLRYIHWECDQAPLPTWQAVDPTGKIQFAFYEGLYSVWERLLERHPDVFIQNNLVGAHRLDLGVIKRSHGGWATEFMSDPHRCRRLQLSGNTFLPASHLGTILAPKPLKGHIGMDEEISDLSCISRMAGMLFISARMDEIEAAPLANLKHWIGVYKRFRHLLMKDYYHLTPQPQDEADWDAGQFRDGTKEGIVLVFRYYGTTDRLEIRMRSLDSGSTYRVTNEKSGEADEYSGKDLMAKGLPVELDANDARYFSYTAV
jgi:hypothetical protein